MWLGEEKDRFSHSFSGKISIFFAVFLCDLGTADDYDLISAFHENVMIFVIDSLYLGVYLSQYSISMGPLPKWFDPVLVRAHGNCKLNGSNWVHFNFST